MRKLSYAMTDNYARIYPHELGRPDKIKGSDILCGYCGEELARLIVAAPDLLEALEEALENWEDDHFDEDYPYRAEWADKAREAIKKARGEK